jgi:hypothetical protein
VDSTAPGRLRRPFQSHVDSCFKDGSNTKHCAMTLDYAGGAVACRLRFLLCPSPFQRLSVTLLICFIHNYILIFIFPSQSSPPRRVLLDMQ